MATTAPKTQPSRRPSRLIAGVGAVGVTVAYVAVGLSSVPAQAADVDRIGGSDRIATAIAAYESDTSLYTGGVALLARADGYADALVAGSAAAAAKAPLFMTPSGGLDRRVLATLKKHKITQVAVIGGEGALSAKVVSQLKAADVTTVRVGGKDRFDTARQVAGHVLKGTKRTSSPVFLATGMNYADALATVPAAHKSNSVILLSNNGLLDSATSAYLASKKTTGVVAVGGPAAAAAKKHRVKNATPVIGKDRFETATLLASTYFSDAKKAYLASGTVYADAMAGGPLAALTGGPILMTFPTALSASTRSWLDARKVDVTILGGTGAVSAAVAKQVDAVVDTPTSTPSTTPTSTPSTTPTSTPSTTPTSTPSTTPTSTPSTTPTSTPTTTTPTSTPSSTPTSTPTTTTPPPSGGGGSEPIVDPVSDYQALRKAALSSTQTATLGGRMKYSLAVVPITATGSPTSQAIEAQVADVVTFKRDDDGTMTVNAPADLWRTTAWKDKASEYAGKDQPVTEAQVQELTGLPASTFTMTGLLSRVLTENGPFGTELTGGTVGSNAIIGTQQNRVTFANNLPTSATDGAYQSVTIRWN